MAEVPWNDEHGNRYVADVGLKNAQTGELTGCIEVVHTHINADKKEKAIDSAVGQRRLLYAEAV